MGIRQLFQGRAANHADQILNYLRKTPASELTAKGIKDILKGYDAGVSRALLAKAEKNPDIQARAKIVDLFDHGIRSLEINDPAGFRSAVNGILSFRTYEAAKDTFGYADILTQTLVDNRRENSGLYTAAQPEGMEIFARHLQAYSEAVGSGSAGYRNMERSVANYMKASRGYDAFGLKAKADEVAFAAEACALRHGVSLKESSQAYVNSRRKATRAM